MKARIVLIAMGGVLALVVLLLLAQLGVPVDFALAWLIIIVAIALVCRQVFFDDARVWPPPERSRSAHGSDVSRLAWAINARSGVAGPMVVRRVRNVLGRRLAHRGFDLDDPEQHERIDAILGAGVRELLGPRDVLRVDIERVLDAIDRLPTHIEEKR